MRRTIRTFVALATATIILVPTAGAGHPDVTDRQHGGSTGHLPESIENVELVGKVRLTNQQNGIGDVSALGQYAYLAAWAGDCFAPSRFEDTPLEGSEVDDDPAGGVHVVDISIPQLPRKVAFIPAGKNTYVGEGVHVLHIDTPKFDGDVLVMANEPCSGGGGYNGGISLWDVTDPTDPQPLAIGVGDRSPKPPPGVSAHPSHSAMAWDAGRKAYAVLVDNVEFGSRDVDILDITNPRRPKLIAETGLAQWPPSARSQTSLGSFGGSFHHDMWVKKINGRWRMIVSYWDAGWVLLDVDNPKRPKYIRDFDYRKRDLATGKRSEGNAHQAYWSSNNKFLLGTDEDFFARFSILVWNAGGNQRFAQPVEYPWTPPIAKRLGTLEGPTMYGGTGCPPLQAVPPASNINAKGRPTTVVLIEGGGCSFEDKLGSAEQAGYDAVIVAASHQTAGFGTTPGAMECTTPLQGGTPPISALCISHPAFHDLFGTAREYVTPFAEVPVGERGPDIQFLSFGDGIWGGIHLMNGTTLKELDAFIIPEAKDPQFAGPFGNLTVHEVKTDPRKGVNLAYVSWYAGGLRVLSFGKKGFKEVGHYVDGNGNNFWGTFPLRQGSDPPLLLMSDMDYGLFILRYTGPQ